jgi:hypothetical protein
MGLTTQLGIDVRRQTRMTPFKYEAHIGRANV